jgi:hypothetical protein
VFTYFLRSHGALVLGSILFIGIFAFFAALWKWNQLQKRKQYLETSIVCDQNELEALDYRFDAFDGAPERIQAAHPFGLDLDIFGNHSLFQSVNRTTKVFGKQVLIHWFEEPLLSQEAIEKRQQAVKELNNKPDFMHRFQVTGQMNQGSDSDKREIETFIAQPDTIRHKKFWKALHFSVPTIWIVLVIWIIINGFSPFLFALIYIFFLSLSESQAKRITRLQVQIGKKVAVLTSYSRLIEAIEQETFESEILFELQSVYLKGEKPASKIIGQLVRLAGELEQRSNLMVHVLFNPLFLWDIHKAMQIDRWKKWYSNQSGEWIQTLSEYDAFISLATFAFTHPGYVFPELTADYFTLKGKNLGHPLMKRETCVRNDIEIEKQPYFLIITGANMAGKSTYLRTIGVNFVLACMGAPVCADA